MDTAISAPRAVAASILSPERVEAQGFVSKNDRLEKADRKPPVKDAGGGIGNMIQYPTNCGE